MSIGSATRSEFTKYFTTSTWWVLTLITAVSLMLLAGGFAAAIGLAQSGALDEVPDAALLGAASPSLVYGLAVNIGYIFPILLGVLLVTGEFRHGTLIPTFLATPRRGTVLLAKLTVGSLAWGDIWFGGMTRNPWKTDEGSSGSSAAVTIGAPSSSSASTPCHSSAAISSGRPKAWSTPISTASALAIPISETCCFRCCGTPSTVTLHAIDVAHAP